MRTRAASRLTPCLVQNRVWTRRLIGPAESHADDHPRNGAGRQHDSDEREREQELAPVLGIDANPVDTEEMHAGGPCGERERRGSGPRHL